MAVKSKVKIAEVEQKPKKLKKYLTIADLDDVLAGEDPVWVMIDEEKSGDVTSLVLSMRSPTTGRLQKSLTVPSRVPVNLTAEKSRTVLTNCDDLKHYIGSGVLRLLTPEYARHLNATEEIADIREAQRQLKSQQSAVRSESDQELSDATKGKIDLNPAVTSTLALLDGGGLTEPAALAKLKTSKLSERDLLAVVSKAADHPAIRTWAQGQIDSRNRMGGDISSTRGNRPEATVADSSEDDSGPAAVISVPRITKDGTRRSEVKTLLHR